MPLTAIQKTQKEIDDKQFLLYSGEEMLAYKAFIDKFEDAKRQRQSPSRFFDDMNYDADFQFNLDSANSYLRAKKNDDEVRIATGMVEKKIEAVENELLSMNLQAEIHAFDQEDQELNDLGSVFTDLIRRTNEVEKDEDFWIEAIQELLTQRAVFIEELYVPIQLKDKRKRGNQIKESIRFKKQAQKRLVSGLKVFLGDISIPAYLFNQQPFIVKYDRVSYSEAKSIFGQNPRWRFVKPGVSINTEWFGGIFNYRFANLKDDEVEILTYASYPDDEYQQIVNGVMMEKIGAKLPWEYEGYNMVMVVLKPMSRNFAYGKPLTASAKTLQALDNETIRNLIRKFRQAIEPPLAVPNRGKIFSRDIFNPASIAYGLKAGDFERLIDHQGVTAGEMTMYDLINKKTEEFIGVSNITQGLAERQQLTATQTIEMQRQAIKMLGLAVLAYMRLKRDVSFLRLNNFLENYTISEGKVFDPIENAVKDAYRRFTIKDSEFENQQKGTRNVIFQNRNLNQEEERQIFDFEEEQAKRGQPVRIVSVNVEK
jgi:hypothetical protein